jgi:hypothetical protein
MQHMGNQTELETESVRAITRPYCKHKVTHDKKYMRLVEENGNIITLE